MPKKNYLIWTIIFPDTSNKVFLEKAIIVHNSLPRKDDDY